jgi:hypothetical protein
MSWNDDFVRETEEEYKGAEVATFKTPYHPRTEEISVEIYVPRNLSRGEVLALYNIREMPDYNPGWNTGSPGTDSPLFSSVPLRKCSNSISAIPRFQFTVHQSYYHSRLYSLDGDAESVVQ